MKRLLDENEYASLYERRSTEFVIGDKVGMLTGVKGEYRSFSITDAVVTDVDAENRIIMVNTGLTDIAIKMNRRDHQVILGRVTKYETSLVKL